MLRAQNVLALSFIFNRLLYIRQFIQPHGYAQRKSEDFLDKTDRNIPNAQTAVIEDGRTPFSTAFTAFNIASFPPLFFFSALYYTDVMSTAAVLISYQALLEAIAKPQKTWSDDLIAIVSGLVALLFRQTNIFWVAVFPAGLTVVSILKDNGAMRSRADKDGIVTVLKESWSQSRIPDPLLRDGGLAVSGRSPRARWKTLLIILQTPSYSC